MSLALSCERYSQNGLESINCRSLLWEISEANQPLAPYAHAFSMLKELELWVLEQLLGTIGIFT